MGSGRRVKSGGRWAMDRACGSALHRRRCRTTSRLSAIDPVERGRSARSGDGFGCASGASLPRGRSSAGFSSTRRGGRASSPAVISRMGRRRVAASRASGAGRPSAASARGERSDNAASVATNATASPIPPHARVAEPAEQDGRRRKRPAPRRRERDHGVAERVGVASTARVHAQGPRRREQVRQIELPVRLGRRGERGGAIGQSPERARDERRRRERSPQPPTRPAPATASPPPARRQRRTPPSSPSPARSSTRSAS